MRKTQTLWWLAQRVEFKFRNRNPRPAIVFGLLASYLSVLLFLCDVLPGVERIPDNTMSFSTWSLVPVASKKGWRPPKETLCARICREILKSTAITFHPPEIAELGWVGSTCPTLNLRSDLNASAA